MAITKDILWKGIIESLFEDFLYYFFPNLVEEIDTLRGFEFLDKELEQLFPESESGHKYADKLVKVWLKDGREQWLLVHIEVQGYVDRNFAERMFIYFYRIRDTYNKPIVALAILTDTDPGFHPNLYEYHLGETWLRYSYKTFKLLNETNSSLIRIDNPFSIIMQTAHVFLKEKKLTDENKKEIKLRLVRDLYKAKYSKEKIRHILNFIRFYVRFKDKTVRDDFDKIFHTIIKSRQPMGIEEAILHAVRQDAIKELEPKLVRLKAQLKKANEKAKKLAEQKLVEQKLVEQKLAEQKLAINNMLIKGFSFALIKEILGVSAVLIKEVQQNLEET